MITVAPFAFKSALEELDVVDALPEGISELDNAVSETTDAADALQQLSSVVEKSSESGGLSQNESELLAIATESIMKPFAGAIKVTLPATESFATAASRAHNTNVALESFMDKVNTLWKAIVDFIKTMYLKISDWFLEMIDSTDRTIKQAEYISKLALERDVKGKVSITDFPTVKFNHITDSSRYFRMNKLIDALSFKEMNFSADYRNAKSTVDHDMRELTDLIKKMKDNTDADQSEKLIDQLLDLEMDVVDKVLEKYKEAPSKKLGEKLWIRETAIGGKASIIMVASTQAMLAKFEERHLESVHADFVNPIDNEKGNSAIATFSSNDIVQICSAIINGCKSFKEDKSDFYKLRSFSHELEKRGNELDKLWGGSRDMDKASPEDRFNRGYFRKGMSIQFDIIKSFSVQWKELVVYAYQEVLTWRNACHTSLYICKESIKLDQNVG
jgi:hypothetical protein